MALALLGCLFLFCLIIASAFLFPLLHRVISRPEAFMRISAVIQDLLLFIVPAIGMAVVVTKLPARLLCVDFLGSPYYLLAAVVTLLVSIPAMNCVVAWNESWHLPESMSALEELCRQMEETSRQAVDLLMSGSSIGALIVSILIVGVLAGFSEELFFRGALQRVISMCRINHHVAIWLTAFIFSAFHFQLFGFVPRMLLGAYFGYLLYWSRSLWVPMVCHIVNNTLVVLSTYYGQHAGRPDWGNYGSHPESLGEISAVIISLTLIGLGLFLLARRRVRIAPASGS